MAVSYTHLDVYKRQVLLDADVAVFPQCELAVPTGIQVGDQRFHDFAPAVFFHHKEESFIVSFCQERNSTFGNLRQGKVTFLAVDGIRQAGRLSLIHI